MRWVVTALVFLSFNGSFAARKYDPLEVPPALTTELNTLLAAVDRLHGACVLGDEERVQSAANQVLKHLALAKKKSPLAEGQRQHLVRVLDAIESDLELAKSLKGDGRVEPLQSAFKQTVQLAQTYKLDRYQIFFCPLDRSVWLQKSTRPKNPIHPRKHGDCGKLVRSV